MILLEFIGNIIVSYFIIQLFQYWIKKEENKRGQRLLEEEYIKKVEQEKIREEQERNQQLEEEKRRKVEQEKIIQEEVRKRQIEEENRRKVEQEKRIEEQERIRQIEEENKRKVEEENRRQEQERNRYLEEENRRKIEQEKIRQQQEDRKRVQQQKERNNQLLQPIQDQVLKQQQIQKQPIQQQIVTLNQEIQKLDNNNKLTNNQKQYYKHQFQQQLFTKLKDSGQAKSIPHIKQNIEASNPELALYVLKESLLRDQNRELLATSQQYSNGFDSILGAYGSDQSCLKVRNTNLDYDSIVNDTQLLEQHLLEFKQKLSNSLNISIDQIEILGVSKGSFEIKFQITGNKIDDIQQQIYNKPEAQKFLKEYCNGKIEQVAYFDKASASGAVLSSDDFNPSHNMSWDGFHEKEQRGPPYHRYDYYFPIGCYGFGLNVKKYGDNQDWILMNGNQNEWRIMYHGTKQHFVGGIVKSNLQPGTQNRCSNYTCLDEFNNQVKVGNGIYFSNNFNVCIKDGYANYTYIGDKQFAVIFMSRVNPKKIRQSSEMIPWQYFVINKSEDVRPYRILLHEKK
ncbi:unnamed protein product (macronuclear) [Paramecium tetraurelia]|uniref:PARP catalytic domain-containing protein n=1 Tax=Paramecium tetraurelia TaxID=5888 RepID=A0DE02_PARTE|nr:uncharacterized protein GSPATT00016111001 [Paramecium tetraurelia]CAK81269.1 unnamed protein product [Paramecium tetraurelia]|eukprot:XP_001448666.1 hypothetical protein (macronuclear) [Paramecium tetraurelia strain d4-2]